MKQLNFKTREGKKQNWNMLVTGAEKALKSVATTCDGDVGGECHVIFTRHVGTIVKVDAIEGSHHVGNTGVVKGVGELTDSDRTGNTYGMEAWLCVGGVDKASQPFVRPVAAP